MARTIEDIARDWASAHHSGDYRRATALYVELENLVDAEAETIDEFVAVERVAAMTGEAERIAGELASFVSAAHKNRDPRYGMIVADRCVQWTGIKTALASLVTIRNKARRRAGRNRIDPADYEAIMARLEAATLRFSSATADILSER